MLKTIRVIIATLFMAAITLLFLDYTGTVHAYLGWCAKIQFVPAVLALIPAFLAVNILIAAGLLLITLLFGRVYCSALCPLGVFQDLISWKAGWFKKGRFSYRPPKKALVALRFAILALFILAVVTATLFNVPAFAALVEPYSAYGRVAAQLFAPLYKFGNNILAGISERAGSYTFYTVDVWLTGAGALAAAASTFVIVGVFAWKSGRGYCNAICPAGTALGVISKFALIKPRIDKKKCVNCGVCIKYCKAGCIDPIHKDIDYLRCVSCFNCVKYCSLKAMKYTTAGNMKKR